MSDAHERNPHGFDPEHVPGKTAVEFDREIQFRQLVQLGIGLLAVTLLSGVVVFFLLKGFLRAESAAAPPPPVMAPEKVVAPGPKLLARPENDLSRTRAAEEEKLRSYGWVDPAGGVARIPIERAVEIVAERGLPARLAAPAATPAEAATAPTPAAPAAGAPAPGAQPTPAPEGHASGTEGRR
jgi:hypothetical protein